ncbi:glycine cleavage system H protein, mitochondrial isoform X2 [Copidosoma floridanum]|uniref:glycine cleavage system H protein, mitochondrial isoform X2 n=1 Tax=Copidosoma floridanum TaxID=29053 RepID=UPI000C6F959A|nr:glycine cleavage system H protein, mitochondrial isoform X2 [Copidosoma floridanum]
MSRLAAQIAKCVTRSAKLLGHHETTSSVSTRITSNFLARNFFSTHCCLHAERRYTDKHEWVTVSSNIGTVGISDYAQDALGDVVYAQLPDVGTLIKKDEECGALESVKAASEVMSPCSGKVVEKNKAAEDKPGLINSSCYDEGWLFKVELSEPKEVESLMDEDAYNEFLKTDPH